MKLIESNTRKIEALVFGLLWLLVFSQTFMGNVKATGINWEQLIKQWIHLSGYLVVFLLNAYWLVPKLLFNKKYFLFFFAILVLIFIVTGLDITMEPMINRQNDFNKAGFPREMLPKPLLVIFFDNLIFIILVVGAGTASGLVSKWLKEDSFIPIFDQYNWTLSQRSS